MDSLTAPVVEWNLERGFGYLQLGSDRIFLHIRDLSRRRPPKIGDIIRFKMGFDSKGRSCAVDASHQRNDSRLTVGSFFILLLLLLLPGFALKQLALDPRMAVGYLIGISIITWATYSHDKKRANDGGWRIPESTLHLLELIGGWPAAFLAQRCLRHKSSKKSYKFVFWLIVLLHQYLALDSLQHWKFSKSVVSFVQQYNSKHNR